MLLVIELCFSVLVFVCDKTKAAGIYNNAHNIIKLIYIFLPSLTVLFHMYII